MAKDIIKSMRVCPKCGEPMELVGENLAEFRYVCKRLAQKKEIES